MKQDPLPADRVQAFLDALAHLAVRYGVRLDAEHGDIRLEPVGRDWRGYGADLSVDLGGSEQWSLSPSYVGWPSRLRSLDVTTLSAHERARIWRSTR